MCCGKVLFCKLAQFVSVIQVASGILSFQITNTCIFQGTILFLTPYKSLQIKPVQQ